MTDQELKDLVAGLGVANAELAKIQAQSYVEMQIAFKENDRYLKETRQEHDTYLKETRQEHDRYLKETFQGYDSYLKETFQGHDSYLKETRQEHDRFLKEIGQRMGSMASNQGDVAEEFFYNSLSDKPQLGDISFDRVLKNIGAGKPGKPGQQVEFDIVMHNGAAMAIVEVKYKVHPSSLDQIEKQMRRYRELFPEYKDYKLYGGVAGFSVPDDVVEQAHQRGLFVLKRKGDVVETDSDAMRAF
jgi:hypothetical protein